MRVCHFGDFGQSALRPEQREAIGAVDLLFLPVGGGPTIGAAEAAEITSALDPRWVVPMHYRTPAIDFLEPADEFLALFERGDRGGAGARDRAGRRRVDRRPAHGAAGARGAEGRRPAMAQSMQSLYAYGRAFDVALIAAARRGRRPRSSGVCSWIVASGRCERWRERRAERRYVRAGMRDLERYLAARRARAARTRCGATTPAT